MHGTMFSLACTRSAVQNNNRLKIHTSIFWLNVHRDQPHSVCLCVFGRECQWQSCCLLDQKGKVQVYCYCDSEESIFPSPSQPS